MEVLVPDGNDEGDEEACDDQNYGLRLIDLSRLAWTSQYGGPASGGDSAFQVPKVVYDAIGGNEQGSATQTAPAAGFETADLASLFQRANLTSFASGTTGPSPAGNTSPSSSTSTSTPKTSSNTGAIAGGVVGGIAGVTIVVGIVCFLLKRRKKTQRAEMAGIPAAYEVDAQSGRAELGGDRQWPAPKPVVYEMYSEHAQTSPLGHNPRHGPVEM
ncbi:hypothetical protein BDV96DRAFT_573041 [Lophiotrema nucula]|uniref:Mid2 domain-containing protein n=1 Tax=Lophiotrema nucula TaxID=690887 RepID=A0A6A5ZEK7_9PLEO|nr:hypothetical protein BDV96DRAFT_573041 [Lophiotrema nucula]